MLSIHCEASVRGALLQSQRVWGDCDSWLSPYGTRSNLVSQCRDRSIPSRVKGITYHHHPRESTMKEEWNTRPIAEEFNIDPLEGTMISKVKTLMKLPRLLRSTLKGSSMRYEHDHSDWLCYLGDVSNLCSSHRPLTQVSWPREVQGIRIVMYSVTISNT